MARLFERELKMTSLLAAAVRLPVLSIDRRLGHHKVPTMPYANFSASAHVPPVLGHPTLYLRICT